MGFNELNSVEHYIIHQLSGLNLNSNEVQEPKVSYGAQWQYKSAADLNRSVNEVLIEQELKDALIVEIQKGIVDFVCLNFANG